MLKKFVFLNITILSSLLLIVSPASAAKLPASSTTSTNTVLGNDVSYPQCGVKLPTNQAFGIVGINGGNAATINACLSAQLAWAKSSSGAVASQDKVQMYVNTGNPGQVMEQMSTKWPSSNTAPSTNPYGSTCTGGNDQSCSWQYGWDRAQYSVDYFVSKAAAGGVTSNPGAYKWWLDVETMNTWQSGSPQALANNVAALEGWAANFKYLGARVGLYSTASQWSTITGNLVSSNSNLLALDNWRPGGANLVTAKQACSAAPLTTGGKVGLTQYISRSLDYDNVC